MKHNSLSHVFITLTLLSQAHSQPPPLPLPQPSAPNIWNSPPYYPDFQQPTGRWVRQPKYKLYIAPGDANTFTRVAFLDLYTKVNATITEHITEQGTEILLNPDEEKEWRSGPFGLRLQAPLLGSVNVFEARGTMRFLERGFDDFTVSGPS